MTAAAATTLVSGAPIWVVLLAAAASGVAGATISYWQARKLLPSQTRDLAASVQQRAVDTVNTALEAAQGRITDLEDRVTDLNRRIGEMRDELAVATKNRGEVDERLTLALIERAKLQRQLNELRFRMVRKEGSLVDVAPPDAIVMIDMTSGEITYANEGVYSLFGYAPSTLVGKSLETLVPEAKRATHRKDRLDYAQHPRTRQMGTGLPLQARTTEGDIIDVDISLHPTGDGRVLALIKRREDAISGLGEQSGVASTADGGNVAIG